MIKNQTKRTFQEKTNKHKTKIQIQYNKTYKTYQEISSLTDQIFTEDKINILEKDFNYAITPTNIPKEE